MGVSKKQMAKIIHCLLHYPQPLSPPVAAILSQALSAVISSAAACPAMTDCDLCYFAVLITNLLFCDSVGDGKGPWEAGRERLIFKFS